MKIKNIRTLSGPNTYHHHPVLMMTIDLQERAETSSKSLPGFVDRLVALLPGLKEHRCSPGRPGGFIERLNRGTYFAHMIEHVALELSHPSGIKVGFGKSIYGGSHGVYHVIVRYQSEPGMKHLLTKAVEVIDACADGKQVNIDEIIHEARQIAEAEKFGPSTQAVIDAAVRRGIPWRRMNDRSLIEFGYGSKRKLLQATITGLTSHIGVAIAQDKSLTKALLGRMGVPVPRGESVATLAGALEVFNDLGGPVTVKPLDGNHGNGVCLNLKSEEAVTEAFDVAREFSRKVLVEQFYTGKDFRLLVIGGKLVAAAERIPAHVIGDGKQSIQNLIDQENRNPLRGEGHEKPMTKITIDRAAAQYLERAQIRLDSVPMAGERIQLRNTANLSKGGSAVDVTDLVHADIQVMCERAARVVALDVCGIDLIIEDIARPLAGQRGGVIEVNAAPGIRMHHYPTVGKSRDVGSAIIDHLFPNGETGRIPIITITGTNGKTTVTRLIAHGLHENSVKVGMTTSAGIYLGKTKISSGDTTGPVSAKMILEDPWVDVAVLETARGGIVKRGLGFDFSDLAVITNVQPDHIGQDGIESVDDILRIKSLVAESVRDGGTLILNADDSHVASLTEKASVRAENKNVVFFSLSKENPRLQNHFSENGTGFYYDGTSIFEVKNGVTTEICEARTLPFTIGGTAKYQVSNALAAAAAMREMGMSKNEVIRSLRSFNPILDNAGRANFFRVKEGYVVVDFGHNADALRSVCDMAKHWNTTRLTGIISAPGDRTDEIIKMSGHAAAEFFDRIIIREDVDLRGRPARETADMLCAAAKAKKPEIETYQMLDEPDALEFAVSEMVPGEVIFFFYDNLARVMRTLEKVGAKPIKDLSELSGLVGRPIPVEVSAKDAKHETT
ncbi:MAG: cyanophycin synthetase [Cryobacterium sp.]|nr:cyanophycin synthetase [Oligoflexia bacterium]